MKSTFADRLKQTLYHAGVNQKTLSEKTGFSKAAISQYLSGKNTPPPERIKTIAKALGITVDSLIRVNGDPVKETAVTVPMNLKITVKLAARCLGKSDQFVTSGLQAGVLPFGVAVHGTGGKWNYFIQPEKFREFVGESRFNEFFGGLVW